jgi:CubicO group peptidase (beta-lactamase class C family)
MFFIPNSIASLSCPRQLIRGSLLNVDQLEQQIETQMKAGHVPGFAIAIVHGQEVIYARGFGVTSVEDGELPRVIVLRH